jgi:cytoskeletal protein RodZ
MEQSGKIFKTEREKRKLSIAEVSKTLKIREHIIQAIESGNLDILPHVYMKAFIKDYSSYLKINTEVFNEIISSLTPKDDIQILADESEKEIFNKPVTSKRYEEIFADNKIKKQFFNKQNIVNYLIFTALILILVATIYFAFFDFSSNDKNNQKFIAVQNDTLNVTNQSNGLEQAYNPTDSITLSVESTDSIWTRISMDGKRTFQQVLLPYKEMEFKAWEYFQITCDDASALKVKRNGESIAQLSSKGKVIRNVKITRNEVINPTASINDTTQYKRKRVQKKVVQQAPKPILIQPSKVQGVKPTTH